ncbi:MAG TPA: c-type cytochrome [Ardenticatenaceae bacterium]
MVASILSFVVVIALFLLLAWLTRRLWRVRNPGLRWLGVIVFGLLTAVVGLVTVVALVGAARLNLPQSNPVPDATVAGTPEQIARGERLVNICAGCHSTTLAPPLDGSGENFVPEFGTLYPPNLTPYHLGDWSDGEIVRAIREGVGRDGRALLIMPSSQFRHMSDDDVQSVVAFLRSQPSVDRDVPETSMNVLGSALVGAGMFPTSVQPPITEPIIAPPLSDAVNHGEYLVNITGCRECHGADLTGGVPGGFTPVGPNLRAVVPNWSAEDFINTIRTGVTPEGNELDPAEMPWPEVSRMYSDEELQTIYEYIRQLGPTASTE